MKATGIVRRIDDLGRIVIPKEIRRTLRIKEGDPLEIFTDREGEVILKKYSQVGELGKFAAEFAVQPVDLPPEDAAAGGMKKEYIGKTISDVLENMINERESILAGKTPERHVELTNGESKPDVPQVITPILCGGDAIGSVILSGKDRSVKMGETENALAKCAAGFMGRQMEQ